MENEEMKLLARPIPAEHVGAIAPIKIQDTLAQLDAAIADILEISKEKEAAYQDKAERLRARTMFDTEINLVESEALMNICGDGKEAHVIVNGEKVAMTNDTMRDAYRKLASKDARQKKAVEDAQLARIDTELARINERLQAAKDTAEALKAKANVQAALLNFLVVR
jgi:RNA-splicing ligase RtcB